MNRNPSNQHVVARARGLTLVEMVVSILLVGIMLVGALRMVGASRLGERLLSDQERAHELARDLMEEIGARAYADESEIGMMRYEVFEKDQTVTATLGPESGEDTGTRLLFDDIDDYDKWSAMPPQQRDGTALSGLDGWTRAVDVVFVAHDDVVNVKPEDEGTRLVTVTVSNKGVVRAELSALRTLGPPPMEACVLSDGMCLDLSIALCAAAGGTSLGPWTSCAMDGPVGPVAPRVLLVVAEATNLTSREDGRRSLIESWGMPVSLIGDSEPQSAFDAALLANDVVYVTGRISHQDLGTRLDDPPIGAVSEHGELLDNLGIAERDWVKNGDTVSILDNSHYITSPFSTGDLTVFSSSQVLTVIDNNTFSMAPDISILAEVSAGSWPATAVLESGAQAFGGGTASSRRAHLPYGDEAIVETVLTDDGKTLLKRSLEWAAGFEDWDSGGIGPPATPEVVFESYTLTQEPSAVSSISLDTPPGTSDGDLLIAAIAIDMSAAISRPLDWTELYQTGHSGTPLRFGVFWKIASASEPASHTFPWLGTDQGMGWMMRFTGHDPSDPIHNWNSQIGSSPNPSAPSVLTTLDHCMILRVGGFDDDDITIGDPGLAGHTAILMDESGTGSASTSGGAGYVTQETAASSGTSSFDLTRNEQYITVTIAIAPGDGS